MATRIGGIIVRENSHVAISLTDIFGVGRRTAIQLCEQAGVQFTCKVKDLTEEEKEKLRSEVKKMDDRIEGNLRSTIKMNIERLKSCKSYRGRRHMMRLPCRGQNTKNNSRTRKGPKKPVRK